MTAISMQTLEQRRAELVKARDVAITNTEVYTVSARLEELNYLIKVASEDGR